jgi:transcriptional regulator with GAF, ATPase, and Fis domain
MQKTTWIESARTQRERAVVGESHGEAEERPRRILGRSLALQRVFHEVSLVAGTDSTVLIHGETGSGKELVARAIHEQSGRTGPFVKTNCAALPPALLESELMGHEKGSFTGAHARRIGRFELAQDGTLFLDEIGELPLDVQPKILRLLQEREFERLGSNKTLRSNARVVTATNRDLREMVLQQRFREDLFYRLNVFDIAVPPLRERREDVPDLARHFLALFSDRTQRTFQPVSESGLRDLCAYDWPGNVRELQNVVERAAILAVDGVLTFDGLAARSRPSIGSQRVTVPEVECSLAEIDRRHIVAALDATHWVIAGPHGAALRLGMKRSTLIFRMKKLGIRRRPEDDRPTHVAGPALPPS